MKFYYYIFLYLIFVNDINVFAQDRNEFGVSLASNYPFIEINNLKSITPIEYQGNVSPGLMLFYIHRFNDLIISNIEFGFYRESITEKTTVETIESTYVENGNIIEIRKKSELTEKAIIDSFELLASVYYRLGFFSKSLETISLESGISYSKSLKINYGTYNSSAIDNDLLLKNTVEESMFFFNTGIRFETDIMKGRNLGVYIRHFIPLKSNISSTNRFIGQFDSGKISKIRIGFFISID